jgi:hypothetical protein
MMAVDGNGNGNGNGAGRGCPPIAEYRIVAQRHRGFGGASVAHRRVKMSIFIEIGIVNHQDNCSMCRNGRFVGESKIGPIVDPGR